MFQKHFVYLQGINGKIDKHIQRGISGAKIIHGHSSSIGTKLFQPWLNQFEILSIHTFRQFQFNILRRNLILFKQ